MAYLIQCQATGLVKIGTSVDPDSRIAALQTGSAGQLVLLGAVRQAEKALHFKYRRYRRHGEWFALPASEVAALLATSVVCRECATWYSTCLKRPGEACGDYSQGQAAPCEGIVVAE